MATFLNADKSLSGDGQKLVEWLEVQCAYAENLPPDESTNALNRLHGSIRQYYINVYKLKSHTPQQWVEDFSKSWAQDCWGIMTRIEEMVAQQEQQQQTADKTEQLAAQLAALGERLAAVEAENAALKTSKSKKAGAQAVEEQNDASEIAASEEA